MAIDDRSVEALIAALDHPDKPTIRSAVDALIACAGDSPRVRELLQARLTATGHRNYWPAAYVLGNLPDPPSAVLSALLDALDHPEPDIRWAISLLLARIGKNHHDLVASLIGVCGSGSSNQKRMALYCLRDLALSSAASATAMLSALADPEPTVRVAAAVCLKERLELDSAGKTILLRTYLNDPEPKVRHAAAIALAALGEPAAEFLAALEKNFCAGDQQTRKAASVALDLLKKRRPASSGSHVQPLKRAH
jgi:HEAT repeat protein